LIVVGESLAPTDVRIRTSSCNAVHEGFRCVQTDRRSPFALIVEDHPLVADSLVACIRDCDAELRVETAESLRAALRILAKEPMPLLIVTDLTLTDANGTEAVKRLRAAAANSPLLVFTALDDPELRSEAKALGVKSYLIKNASTQTLRDEIRAALGGRPQGAHVAPAGTAELSGLFTPKQLAVLEELAAGRSNHEIAVRMNISEETVRSHMKEILGRLAVKNRTEAVIRYLQMIKPDARR
jgi:DNA-binding NarL/FixJ family response regulator